MILLPDFVLEFCLELILGCPHPPVCPILLLTDPLLQLLLLQIIEVLHLLELVLCSLLEICQLSLVTLVSLQQFPLELLSVLVVLGL